MSVKDAVLAALTSEWKSYTELRTATGRKYSVSALNKRLRALEAEGLAVRMYPTRRRVRLGRYTESMHSPKVLWRRA